MLISIIGILILALTVLDALLTVLDASGRSIFSTRLYRAFWWCWRHVARLLPGPVAQAALSTAAPLMIALLIATWIGGIVTGFALIFFGGMSFGEVITGGGSQPSLSAAFRLSWVTLSTIGFVEISPSNMAYSVTVALEALLGSVILTFSITYFLSVHRNILAYDRLVADLKHRMSRERHPMETVAAHLSSGDMRGLESWLERLHDGLVGMHQGLSRYPIVYFYRPKERARSLPKTLESLGIISDGLSWCLPGDAAVRKLPALGALRSGLQELIADLRDAYVPLGRDVAPRPVSRAEFQGALTGGDWEAAPSVKRFRDSCAAIRSITGARIAPDDAFESYCSWLPAAERTRAFVTTIAHDLGYDEDLRPGRSSILAQLSRGPKQRPQALRSGGAGR